MATIGTLTLTGYDFEVYAFDANFSAVGAVYAITRRTQKKGGGYEHITIYVGETGDLSTRFDGHHKAACFTRHKANCKCIHRDANEASRLKKEAALIKAQNPPCND